MFGGQSVRVIDAEISVKTKTATANGAYRLITTARRGRLALAAARDQIVHAAGVIAGTVIDLVGKTGRLVLNDLLPERRLPVNARTVKRAISRHDARGPNIDRRAYQATISLIILAPGPSRQPAQTLNHGIAPGVAPLAAEWSLSEATMCLRAAVGGSRSVDAIGPQQPARS
ncbi:hypothetical protein AB0J83_18750 [Actinoplanes sp. NPDC049596]|uniref:hypothetical protein n=1 Tax=unclassified Actinoplanes TaxID=2626549 RepID=UPI00344954F8